VLLNKAEPTYEKGTFEIKTEGGKVIQQNTATGETKELGDADDPDTPDKVVSEIKKQALEVVKTSDGKVSLEDATYDAAIDFGYSEEDAKLIATFTPMPEGDKKKTLIGKWWEFMNKPIKETSLYVGKDKVTTPAKPTFNEGNVTALVKVLHNEVTPAERAFLKSQGATDADIDEAIKRKGK